MIEIDGSQGEGGGQVLRTSLALSIVTGKPFRLYNIRAGRSSPGLKKQHLTCVQAAAEISAARITGASLGSSEVTFEPDKAWAGNYYFRIETAGSAGLVLQTVLPPLLFADGPSSVRVTGGTHNAWAPPFDFLVRAFMPMLARMGARVSLDLEVFGFYPVGGGLTHAQINPWQHREPLDLVERQPPIWWANAVLSRIPDHVGVRELQIARERFNIPRDRAVLRHVDSPGPGNALTVFADCGDYMEVFTGFGKRGKRAEKVADEACDEAAAWEAAGVPVGPHLADQLLLPMALGAGGRFLTTEPTAHTTTNIEVIRMFLPNNVNIEKQDRGWMVTVGRG